MEGLTESLSLKGRISVKNYISEVDDTDISWANFNSKGYNTADITEDDFIEGIHLFKKDFNIEKSEKVDIKKPEEKPIEEKPVEEPAKEVEAPKEEYIDAPKVEEPIDSNIDEGSDTPEEGVKAITDTELEKEATKDLENNNPEVDLGNDVTQGIYKIYKYQWPYLYDTLLRCKKKMGAEFDFKILGEDVVNQKQLYTNNPFISGNKFKPFWGDPVSIPVYIVKIISKVKVNNWTIVATVEHIPTQDGIIIEPVYVEGLSVTIPESFYKEKRIKCDHCDTVRDRNYGAIVYNTETKEFRMVGRSCLKEYTGIDPTMLLALAHVQNVARHWDPIGQYKFKYYDVNDVLLIATAAIRLFGYQKPEYVGSDRWHNIYVDREDSTRLLVRNVYDAVYGNRFEALTPNAKKVYEYIEENLAELRDYSQKAKEYMAHLDTTNDDFKYNIQVALSGNLIVKKQIGLVCCFPHLYAKFVAEEENKKSTADLNLNNKFYPGDIGDTISITNIARVTKGSKQTSRGANILTIFTKDGYELTAFVMPEETPEDVNSIAKVLGKIYRFNTFRDKNSTTLTNVKLYTNEDLYFQDNTPPEAPLGNIKDKITFVPSSASSGPEKAASFSYNTISYYATVTMLDALGHKFIWNCSNESIYTNPESLIGKKVIGTIKKINKDIEGKVESYVIGGRVKVEEAQYNRPMNNLQECHFAELPRNRNKDRLQQEFDLVINKTLENLKKSELQEQAKSSDEIYDEGFDAFNNNVRLDKCPYSNKEDIDSWQLGWKAAEDHAWMTQPQESPYNTYDIADDYGLSTEELAELYKDK